MFKLFKREPKYKQISIEVDGVRLSLELFFVGRENETEIYTEFFQGETKEEALGKLKEKIRWERYPFLPNNNISINTKYFTLAKSVVKSTSNIKITKKIYEEVK